MKILILHNGQQDYVQVAIRQLLEFNNARDIVLLSQNTTFRKLGIEIVNPIRYMTRAKQVKKSYVHLSSNFYNFELFCIQRWFIILEYLESISYKGPFMHMDSDVMCYCAADKLVELYKEFDVTISSAMVPHMMYFKSVVQLRSLCDYIEEMYQKKLPYLQNIYNKEFIVKKSDGGICDMQLIKWWLEEKKINFIDTTYQILNKTCSDSVFSEPDIYLYDKRRHQKVVVRDELGYAFVLQNGEQVHCNCIHFQGKEKKRIIYRYYFSLNNNKPNKLLFKMFVVDLVTIPYRSFIKILKKLGFVRKVKLFLQKKGGKL